MAILQLLWSVLFVPVTCISVVELQGLYGKIVEMYMNQPHEDSCSTFFDDVMVPICNNIATSGKANAGMTGGMLISHSSACTQKGSKDYYSTTAKSVP